jgi:type III pantothenate kinase
MNAARSEPIVAVDVGNSRFKLGLFDAAADERCPTPLSQLEIDPTDFDGGRITDWLCAADVGRVSWRIASVHRGASQRLEAWLGDERGDEVRRQLRHTDLPLTIDVEHPGRVGIDRLLAAVAVNAIREPGRPAIVVDHGSAITVDWVDTNGTFRGGAILPGIGMSARALDQLTDQLPLVDVSDLNAPDALGRSTAAAIRSGLFWGAVGAVGELINQLAEQASTDPQIIVTGGAGQHIAQSLHRETKFVPHLILSGIALSEPHAPL